MQKMSDNFNLESVSAYVMYKEKTVFNLNKEKKKRRKLAASQEMTSELPVKQKRSNKETLRIKKVEKQAVKELKMLTTKKKNMKIRSDTESFSLVQAADEPEDTAKEQNTILGDNPLLNALHVFKWLINPMLPETYFKTYWEQKVLHIKRLNPNYYSHIFDSSALDKVIRNNSLHYTRNLDVVCYENGVKEVFNQEGRATTSAVWDYYSNGCSIRILNPQTYNHKIHLLLATLQEFFGTMVGSNVYLTPPGSQGFAPHYDDIEAFIIQLEGQKHWKLYQPRGADVLARYSSPNLKHEDIGSPFMELTLNAGDMLYFPRGIIHEGYTDPGSHSLHITVSVYQQMAFADLLQHALPNALKKAAEADVDFRKGLPLNFLKHFGVAVNSQDKIKNLVETEVEKLMQSLMKYVDIDAAADLLGKRMMYDSMPPVLSKYEAERSRKADGPYLQNGEVINRVEISLNTRIRLLRFYCIRLVIEDTADPKLYFNTENATVYHGEDEQFLELEPSMVSTIHTLQNTYPCYIEVNKLPMEDETLKLQLIADLWEHGLVVSEQRLNTND